MCETSKDPKKSFWTFCVYIILFSTLYFTLRAPFYKYPLLGEDGFYPDILINSLDRPNYGQAGRIHGVTLHMPLRHPGFMYEIYALIGDGLRPFLDFNHMTIGQITFMMRFIVSLFSYVIWLVFIIMIGVIHHKGRCHNLVLVLMALLILSNISFPFTVSIEQQLDNTSGVLFTGLFALAWVGAYWKLFNQKFFSGLIIVSAFLVGLGKNEWTITLILAAAVTTAFLVLTRRYRKETDTDRQVIIYLEISCAGVILGNIASYLFDPVDYVGGLGLIDQFMGDNYLKVTQKLSLWDALIINRTWFLLISWMLWLLFSTYFAVNFRWLRNHIVFLYAYSSALFFSFFFITSSNISPRYFIPAYFVMTIGLLSDFVGQEQPNLWRAGLASILAVGIIQSWLYFGPYYANNLDKQNYYAPRANMLLSDKGTPGPIRDCILPLGVGENFNLNTEYINISIGWNERKQILARYGEKLCQTR